MKKRILIAVFVILICLLLFFAFLIFVLTKGIAASVEVVGQEIIEQAAGEIVEGLVSGGAEIASEIISDGISSMVGK